MKNFYLIYGLEKSLINNEIKKIKEKLGVSEIIKYSMDKDLLDDIILDASLVSMFSEKKLILIEDCTFFSAGKKNDNIEILENYLDNYNSDTYIIFSSIVEKIDTRKKITKKISDIGSIILVKKKDINYIKKYILDYLNDNDFKVEDINYLISKTGSNIDNVKNEMDKLLVFKEKEKIITNSDINKLIIPNLEDEIFALTDAVINNNIRKSLDLLNEFINKNYDEMQIIILLASQFRFMFQVKRLSNKGMSEQGIASELSANPYRVKITLKNCYYYSEDLLLLYLKKIADLDKNIKLGIIDKNLGLQLFLMNKDYKTDK